MNNSTLCTRKFKGHFQRSPGAAERRAGAPAPLSLAVDLFRPPAPPERAQLAITAYATTSELTTRISKEKSYLIIANEVGVKRGTAFFLRSGRRHVTFVVLLPPDEA